MRNASLIVLFLIESICLAEQPAPRKYYRAKLEPKTQILHGAGQGKVSDVQAYADALKNYSPVIFMDYFRTDGDPDKFTQNLTKPTTD